MHPLKDMYAIVNIAGQQFKVSENQNLYVHRLKSEEGSSVEFDNVLLVDKNGNITLGTPSIKGATVKAKVLTH